MRSATRLTARVLVLVASTFGLAGPAAAIEGDGLTVPAIGDGPASRWQPRVAIGTSASPGWRSFIGAAGGDNGLQLRGLSLMGDYYFRPSLARQISGFRATSGLLIGNRASLPLADGIGGGLTVRGSASERRNLGLFSMPLLPGVDTASDNGAVPYLGFGYTGASAKGGFSFSADLGLMALNPGSAVKLGRVFSGAQNLDDMVRDMRLSPVLQLGVSYSF